MSNLYIYSIADLHYKSISLEQAKTIFEKNLANAKKFFPKIKRENQFSPTFFLVAPSRTRWTGEGFQ